jgi:hypothetical protein
MIGTLTVSDLLASRFQYLAEDWNMTVRDYGENAVGEIANTMLAEHNQMMMDVVGDWATWTNEPLAMYGTADYVDITEGDEMGTFPPQKAQFGSIVGFPLRKYGGKWQGSRDYFARATVGEVVAQVTTIQDADRRKIIQQVVGAIFSPTNYLWADPLVNRIKSAISQLPVRALVNADGNPIPPGPNGELFNAATHTHYMFSTGFTTADLVALKENVLEHYADADAAICIPRGLEAAVRAMGTNFVALLPGIIIGPITAAQDPSQPLNTIDINNRLIGEFDGIPVWVKPWVPAGYALCGVRNHNKVVGVRTDPMSPSGGQLTLAFKDEVYPLRSESYVREFGCGVWERTGAAVLMTNTGGGVYVAPTTQILY